MKLYTYNLLVTDIILIIVDVILPSIFINFLLVDKFWIFIGDIFNIIVKFI